MPEMQLSFSNKRLREGKQPETPSLKRPARTFHPLKGYAGTVLTKRSSSRNSFGLGATVGGV